MIPKLGSSAKETTESVTATLKNLYTNALQCSPDLSLNLALPSECHAGRDGDGEVTLDRRADPSTSMSDLNLVVYDGTAALRFTCTPCSWRSMDGGAASWSSR